MKKKKKDVEYINEEQFSCPACGSLEVASASEQLFMVNSGEHYCYSKKEHDSDSRAICTDCDWTGFRYQLVKHSNN